MLLGTPRNPHSGQMGQNNCSTETSCRDLHLLFFLMAANMSHKRKHDELADVSHSTGSDARKKQFKPGKAHPKSKGKHPQAQADADAASTKALKSRVRDLKRLLQHVEDQPKHKMPANIRIERERELEACEHELVEKRATAQEAERRSRMISKYHQVRFFR